MRKSNKSVSISFEDLTFHYVPKNFFNEKMIEFLRVVRSNPLISATLFTDVDISREQQEHWYKEEYSKSDSKSIYICKRNDNNIGWVQFDVNFKERTATVGYVVDVMFQGNGIGKKMIRWSVENAKKIENHLNKLRLEVLAVNSNAINIYKKCGFSEEKTLCNHVLKNGYYHDVIVMTIPL